MVGAFNYLKEGHRYKPWASLIHFSRENIMFVSDNLLCEWWHRLDVWFKDCVVSRAAQRRGVICVLQVLAGFRFCGFLFALIFSHKVQHRRCALYYVLGCWLIFCIFVCFLYFYFRFYQICLARQVHGLCEILSNWIDHFQTWAVLYLAHYSANPLLVDFSNDSGLTGVVFIAKNSQSSMQRTQKNLKLLQLPTAG